MRGFLHYTKKYLTSILLRLILKLQPKRKDYMSGNHEGGLKAAQKIKERDPDYYKRIGSIGGKKKVPKGFALDRERAKTAGRKGGQISKRGPSK
jgi:uncharacterized protein